MEFISGLIGALVGGAFVLAGSWLQGRQQAKVLALQMRHERELAAADHRRQQIARENERNRARLESQVTYGRRRIRAAADFQDMAGKANSDEEYPRLCRRAMAASGFSRDDPAPYPSFMDDSEIEDEELRQLVADHRDHLLSVEFAFVVMDPDELPENCRELYKTVDSLARRIDMRWRKLQRDGQPV